MTDNSLQEHFVPSTAASPGRRVWTYRPPHHEPTWAILFLDAELYIDRVKAPEVLDQLQEQGQLEPTMAVFVSNNDDEARHVDYACNPAYTRFVHHSGVFHAAICQSPSFWWESERFRSSLLVASDNPTPHWVCVGNQETEEGVSHDPTGLYQAVNQRDGCERGSDALRKNGHRVHYRVYDGGHDTACWHDDLLLALPWAQQPTHTDANI